MERAQAEQVATAMIILHGAIGEVDAVISRMAPGEAKRRMIEAVSSMLRISQEEVLLPVFRDYPEQQ